MYVLMQISIFFFFLYRDKNRNSVNYIDLDELIRFRSTDLYVLLPLFVIVKIFIIRLCDKHNRNKNFTNKFLLFTVLISSTYLFILSLYLSTIEERIGLIRPQSYQERSKTKIFRSQDEHSSPHF
jgi:C4-dicarboxylate transporter